MTLLRLNTDVQLVIMENLGEADLLSIAQTNEHLSAVAAYEFKRKYFGKYIEIIDPEPSDKVHYSRVDFGYLRNAETILNILKHFGSSITRLKIVYLSDEANSNTTMIKTENRLINLQCAKSLLEIDIRNYYESFFDEMVEPFERCENVTICGQFKKLGNSNMTLAEMFPSVKRLDFPKFEVADKSGIVQEYPHLEYLNVEAHDGDDKTRLNDADITKMLSKNPQIRNLKLFCDNLTLVQTVNELLPNLESLRVESHSAPSESNNNTINFRNLKVFTMYPGCRATLNNIHFEQLEELHTDAFPGSSHWGIKLANQIETLQRLYIDLGCVGDKEAELLLMSNLRLTELSLNFCLSVDESFIVEFVRRNQNIKTFQIGSLMDTSVEFIKQHLGNDWKITDILKMPVANYKILIERK